MPLKLPIPARIPLLYVILGVLLAISVLPMYFYSAQIEDMNRERLKTNEMLLQNTVTRSRCCRTRSRVRSPTTFPSTRTRCI